MSVNLRNRKYVFRGEQLSADEYQKKISEIEFSDREQLNSLVVELKKVKSRAIHRYADNTKSIGSTGNCLTNNKNCQNCFNAIGGEDLVNCLLCEAAKDCLDCLGFGRPGNSELLYEVHGVGDGYNSSFINMTYHVADSQYVSHSYNIKNCFGCSGLKGQRFCILNKQYTEEEYNKKVAEIIKKMTEDGEYGEFFPQKLSPFGYNETEANDFFPLTREEALSKGWNWREDILITKGKETLKNVPPLLKDIPESITKEILACTKCGRNYKIIKQEFDFYKKQKLPVPDKCPDCRHLERLDRRNKFVLHRRTCNCANTTHGHGDKCTSEFDTIYEPACQEEVYCEECYQKEIY